MALNVEALDVDWAIPKLSFDCTSSKLSCRELSVDVVINDTIEDVSGAGMRKEYISSYHKYHIFLPKKKVSFQNTTYVLQYIYRQ